MKSLIISLFSLFAICLFVSCSSPLEEPAVKESLPKREEHTFNVSDLYDAVNMEKTQEHDLVSAPMELWHLGIDSFSCRFEGAKFQSQKVDLSKYTYIRPWVQVAEVYTWSEGNKSDSVELDYFAFISRDRGGNVKVLYERNYQDNPGAPLTSNEAFAFSRSDWNATNKTTSAQATVANGFLTIFPTSGKVSRIYLDKFPTEAGRDYYIISRLRANMEAAVQVGADYISDSDSLRAFHSSWFSGKFDFGNRPNQKFTTFQYPPHEQFLR